MAPKTNREKELEARVAALEAQIAARSTDSVLPDQTNTNISPTDADILREQRAGRRMRTPAEVAELERQGIIIPPPGARQQAQQGPRHKTGYTEDEDGNLTIGPTFEDSPVPAEGRKTGKNVDNTGDIAVESTDGVL